MYYKFKSTKALAVCCCCYYYFFFLPVFPFWYTQLAIPSIHVKNYMFKYVSLSCDVIFFFFFYSSSFFSVYILSFVLEVIVACMVNVSLNEINWNEREGLMVYWNIQKYMRMFTVLLLFMEYHCIVVHRFISRLVFAFCLFLHKCICAV